MRTKEIRWMRVSVSLTEDKERVLWCPGDNANAPLKDGGQKSPPRILLFGCAHFLVAEDSVLSEQPAILIIQVRCPDF